MYPTLLNLPVEECDDAEDVPNGPHHPGDEGKNARYHKLVQVYHLRVFLTNSTLRGYCH